MPELPEVETYRTELEPRLVGRTFRRVEIFDPRLTRPADPVEVAAELEGERVASVDRRGKYLVVRFESGLALLVHLRMTGGFPVEEASHVRASVELSGAGRLRYRDVRRFGTWLLLAPDELDAYLAERLGREPLERGFDSRYLGEEDQRAAGSRESAAPRPAGRRRAREHLRRRGALVGADQSLRPGNDLTADEVRTLVRGVRTAIRRGIERQGADLGDGAYTLGAMQDEFRAYGRTGEPCRRCRTPIEKTRAGGRGTHFCPRCQR